MELNIDCDEGVPLVPRGGYRAGDDGRSVPLGTPERVGHRAVNHEIESDGNTSDVQGTKTLTDSSSEDEDGVQGGRVKRLVKGIEKMRRVCRKPLPLTHESSDDEGPPGVSPSSDDNCPASEELDSEISEAQEEILMNREGRDPHGANSEAQEDHPALQFSGRFIGKVMRWESKFQCA